MIVEGKGDEQGLGREGMGNSDDRRIATSPPAPLRDGEGSRKMRGGD
jgi:hypothetical protein